ncbi:hypothetical protein CCUS01_11577 [Colletotrichum cuscutae]|uniref:Uncharacterized protein n=1 Tax=Colletotrichum cuscutae TaxID=1209917 RepID=A0AAI9XFU3_9PEZI|nr:hypothetical protein CCUS01_11577 [Colletotrichum cuscutae]
MADTKDISTRTNSLSGGGGASKDGLTFARRGEQIDESISGDISGFDAERMRARSLLTADEEKKLMRRVDLRIMTICSLLFLMKNIDSDNISNARIMNKGTPRNIMTQLNMTSDEYNLLTVPYIVLEAPSNLLLKRLRPSAWQSRIMISWGIALLCHVPVTNKGGIYATRFLLGAFEAGMFPGVILQMTYWYRPDEMSIRLLYFSRAQLLNLPISLLSIFVIGVTGFFADKGTVPRPLYPLGVFAVVIACYGVLVAYPSNGAVYAATLVGNAFTSAFFPLMWPWRVQTTSRATGSAFSIGFVNSYGQIGGAIGPQIFRSKYAPRYQTSFAAAMALVGCCAIVTLITWWPTRKTESDTRRLKRARVGAERDGLAVLNDVVDQDLNKKRSNDEESA